jgi:NAD(P)-dependent dehydrogenase (short-subunit alcohol dehydrogenase family)
VVKAALDLSGRIDVLINNAGLMTFADMLTVEDAVWDNIYAVNVRAPMRIMRAVLPEMVKAKRGSVINIGSSWSSRASVFNQDGGGVDYCSSKAALQSLTRAAAQDVAAKGVRVNVIAPGAVDTPMHADHRAKLFEYEKYIPLGRMQLADVTRYPKASDISSPPCLLQLLPAGAIAGWVESAAFSRRTPESDIHYAPRNGRAVFTPVPSRAASLAAFQNLTRRRGSRSSDQPERRAALCAH